MCSHPRQVFHDVTCTSSRGLRSERVLRGIVGSKASNPEAKLLTFFHFLVVSLDSIPQLLHAIGQARLARFGQRFQLPCNTHSSSASVFPQMGARQKAESISFHRQSPNSLDPERPSTYILFPPASFRFAVCRRRRTERPRLQRLPFTTRRLARPLCVARCRVMTVMGSHECAIDTYPLLHLLCVYVLYLMAAANAADPKTERNRLGGSGRVGPSRAE